MTTESRTVDCMVCSFIVASSSAEIAVVAATALRTGLEKEFSGLEISTSGLEKNFSGLVVLCISALVPATSNVAVSCSAASGKGSAVVAPGVAEKKKSREGRRSDGVNANFFVSSPRFQAVCRPTHPLCTKIFRLSCRPTWTGKCRKYP